MITTKTILNNCPFCGYNIDQATGEQIPREGDVTMCFKCLNISVFDVDLKLNKLSEELFAELRRDQEIWNKIEHYRDVLRSLKSKRNTSTADQNSKSNS